MKKHKTNYKKYITLITALTVTLVGVATVHENVNSRDNIMYEVAKEEITEINPSNTLETLALSYGTKPDDVDWNSIFNFVDQNGNPIDESLLDVQYLSIDAGSRKNLKPIQDVFNEKLLENNYDWGNFYVTSVATLKSNPEVKWEPYNWNYSTLRINSKNDNPSINTKQAYLTAYEGKPYKEWENIEFSDYEDDRDNKEMQRLVDYPDDFDKDSMKPGTYSIYYGVTDSQGIYKETKETLTVVEVQPPVIKANINTLKATSEKVDLLKTLDITATDSFKVRARNSYGKTTEETVEVKVIADSPTLEAKNVELTQENRTFNLYKDIEFTATDNVDGDITSKVEVKGNVNLKQAGRYFVDLAVTNSNGKTTNRQITVTVNPTLEEEVPETPEVPEQEVPETPEAPEVEVPEIPEVEVPKNPEVPEQEVPEQEVPEQEVPEQEVPEQEVPEQETPETPEVEDETNTTDVTNDPKKVEENVDKQGEKAETKVEKEDETEVASSKDEVPNDLKKEESEKVKEPEKDKKASPNKLLQTNIPTINSAISGFTGLVTLISGLIGFNFFKKRK